jgi:DNA-directed RNA polymerase subunit beta'
LNYQDAQKSSQLFFISKDHLVSYDVTDEYKNFEKTNTIKLLGNLVRLEQTLWDKKSIPEAGQIISIRKIDNKIILILRKGQPFLFSSRAVFHVFHNDSVLKDNLLLTLFYRRLQTGDIVQGIPKIEEFFEARSSKFGEPLENSVPVKLKTLYENLTRRLPLQKAVRQSVQLIQKYLVDNVQQVYQSQGVTLADKHLEIIVRQMTSKVKIIDGGQTGFLPGELVNLDTIELINQGMEGSRATYEPILLGITKASLETKSFISAASFQETTRILARAAIEKKTDFLKGLKENVILGHVIPAGTGFKEFLALKNINEISD